MLERGKCTQLEAVRWLMSDGEWWGLERLTAAARDWVGITETAASARVRDLSNKLGLDVESAPLKPGSRQRKHRLVLGADAPGNDQGETTLGRGLSAPDFSSPQQLTLGGGGFARNPQEPAPSFSREYPD